MSFKEIKPKVQSLFFKEGFNLNQRMMNMCLIAGILGGCFEMILSFPLHYNKYILAMIFTVVVLDVAALLISGLMNKPVAAAYIFILSVNDLLFPLIFFFNGGLDSGCVLWMVLGLTLPWIFLTGKHRIITFVISFIGIAAALYISALHPEYVTIRENLSSVMIEYIFSCLVISIIYSSLFKYQTALFDVQEKKLFQETEKSIKASQAKTDFLSNVSHDVRTPLNSIIGFTELAKLNNDNHSFVFDCLENISLSSEHLLGLVNQVLDITQIENGVVRMEYDSVSLAALIDRIKKILAPSLNSKNLNLNVNLSMLRDDNIICDTLHLNQILINILTNAIKYSNPDGKIDLTVEQKANSKDGKICIDFKIKDYGVGISKDFCNKIFEPFQRDEDNYSRGIPGTGLGLHIAKSLADLMGGTISVNSEIGKGSEFVVSIDFDVPTLSEIVEDETMDKTQFAGKKVLLVDDNDANREITTQLLLDNGFEVTGAENGDSAIELVSKNEDGYFDLIIMDIHMPGKDGYETTKIIRSLNEGKPYVTELPIIALSAYVYEDDRRRALECGMNGYITKPFSIKELFKILDFILIDDKKRHVFKKF